MLDVLLETDISTDCDSAFALVTGRFEEEKYPELDSAAVDLLDSCGNLDPQPFLDADARATVTSADQLFGDRADAHEVRQPGRT